MACIVIGKLAIRAIIDSLKHSVKIKSHLYRQKKQAQRQLSNPLLRQYPYLPAMLGRFEHSDSKHPKVGNIIAIKC